MLKVKSRVEIESSHIDSTMKKGKQHSKIVMAFGSHDENSVANEDLSWGKIPEVQTTFFFFFKASTSRQLFTHTAVRALTWGTLKCSLG